MQCSESLTIKYVWQKFGPDRHLPPSDPTPAYAFENFIKLQMRLKFFIYDQFLKESISVSTHEYSGLDYSTEYSLHHEYSGLEMFIGHVGS